MMTVIALVAINAKLLERARKLVASTAIESRS
jgi:hypothetical protein